MFLNKRYENTVSICRSATAVLGQDTITQKFIPGTVTIFNIFKYNSQEGDEVIKGQNAEQKQLSKYFNGLTTA